MNEMHEKEGKQYLTSEGRINLGRKSLRNEVWSEKEEFGKVRRRVLLREIRRNERSVMQTLYKNIHSSMDREVLRAVEN